ncbi:uncharacterized protein PG986_001199 [Apiospora aurea]|uniref:Rhodopsin domain-containing protein n=1 Tax=Apiospora aurea TaxID=335848 RepID=A0ABR1QW49_9PEZI
MSLDLSASVLPPPDGMVSNFDDPPSRNNALGLGAVSLMLVVSTLAVAARLYGRFGIARQLKAEDVLIIGAYAAFVAAAWTDLMWLQYPGYFVHAWDIKVETEISALYYAFLFGVFYSSALGLIKIAIPLEWSRIFVPPGTRKKSYFWWGSMFIVALQSLVLVVITILLNVQCIPHEAIWDVTKVAGAKCFPLPILQKVSASTHFVTDVIMVLLPQKVVWSLNLSMQKKVGLAFVFSLGILGVVCSVFRLVDTLALATEKDVFYFTSPVLLWCTAEITCGFIVACAPSLPRTVKESYLLRKIFGSTVSGTGSSSNHHGPRSSYNALSRKRNKDGMFGDTETGMPLSKLDRSESTEHLREASSKDGDATFGGGIVRTTQVTVVKDKGSRKAGEPQAVSAWS